MYGQFRSFESPLLVVRPAHQSSDSVGQLSPFCFTHCDVTSALIQFHRFHHSHPTPWAISVRCGHQSHLFPPPLPHEQLTHESSSIRSNFVRLSTGGWLQPHQAEGPPPCHHMEDEQHTGCARVSPPCPRGAQRHRSGLQVAPWLRVQLCPNTSWSSPSSPSSCWLLMRIHTVSGYSNPNGVFLRELCPTWVFPKPRMLDTGRVSSGGWDTLQ